MIDHLVYLTRNIELTSKLIERAMGVKMAGGGSHPTRGTLNRLLRIGPATYLELLAVDPDNQRIQPPRWMGVDLLPPSAYGKLARWAWVVTDEQPPSSPAAWPPFEEGSRALADGSTLRWKLTDPGASPLVSSTPFLIDWLGRPGPAERLPDLGIQLERLVVAGPSVDSLPSEMRENGKLWFENQTEEFLQATIIGPAGQRMILC